MFTAPLQGHGGGLNSSLEVHGITQASSRGRIELSGKRGKSKGSITLPTSLAPGQSISVQFLLGVQQPGAFRFYVNVEALP